MNRVLDLCRVVPLLLGLAGLVASAKAAEPEAATGGSAPPVPVAHVDLQRYAGVWHEAARIPNRFQKQCASDVTARYEVREDGRLTVINRCVEADGKVNEAKGLAKIVDKATNARLKVSFVSFLGIRPFWGDYWVLGLGEDYEYSVVGTPDRKYGWVLTREADPDPAIFEKAWEILRAQGYDVSRFERSRSTAARL